MEDKIVYLGSWNKISTFVIGKEEEELKVVRED